MSGFTPESRRFEPVLDRDDRKGDKTKSQEIQPQQTRTPEVAVQHDRERQPNGSQAFSLSIEHPHDSSRKIAVVFDILNTADRFYTSFEQIADLTEIERIIQNILQDFIANSSSIEPEKLEAALRNALKNAHTKIRRHINTSNESDQNDLSAGISLALSFTYVDPEKDTPQMLLAQVGSARVYQYNRKTKITTLQTVDQDTLYSYVLELADSADESRAENPKQAALNLLHFIHSFLDYARTLDFDQNPDLKDLLLVNFKLKVEECCTNHLGISADELPTVLEEVMDRIGQYFTTRKPATNPGLGHVDFKKDSIVILRGTQTVMDESTRLGEENAETIHDTDVPAGSTVVLTTAGVHSNYSLILGLPAMNHKAVETVANDIHGEVEATSKQFGTELMQPLSGTPKAIGVVRV